MKTKLISIGVLLIAVICFTLFMFGTINSADGKIVGSQTIHSTECKSYSSGSWGRMTCENVTSKVELFEDGHVEITVVERERVKPIQKTDRI